LAGREDAEIPVKLSQVAVSPGLDGNYRADLTATWPKDLAPVTGSTVQARLLVYQQDAAIAVPTKAIGYGPKGWTVDVKLTNGKTEKRQVKRGRASGDQTEILSGLEIGQVIVSP
jgi:multidrug efflux pump subunit AcrA (membrane-fusion protein)